MLAEQRKTEQAQFAKVEEQAETGICSPCSPSASSPVPRRNLIYSHFKHLGDGRFKCLCCRFRVMKSAKSTSVLFSHLKRRHYFLYLQLATGNPHSKVSVDPQTGTLHKLMPFRQAFAHNYRLSQFFGAYLSLPPSSVVTSPEFEQFAAASIRASCGWVGDLERKLRWAEVSKQFDTSSTCHFSLLLLAFHGRFISHLSLLTSLLHCFHSMSQAPKLPCTSTHRRLDASS